jgi:hypothetical protein
MILGSQPYVRLADLISICWSFAIPVIHLRVFPCAQKRMAAMTVHGTLGSAILLGKDSEYPANIAFYLAHEIAHVALGHLQAGDAIVDLESLELNPENDPEEFAADEYALELLTGEARPMVLPRARRYTAQQLANNSNAASNALRIEPGTLALCFGYSTSNWRTANAAMKYIYTAPKPAWKEINRIARMQMHADFITEDSRTYLESVLGSGESS